MVKSRNIVLLLHQKKIDEFDDISCLESDPKNITCSTQSDFSFADSPVLLSDSDDSGDFSQTDHCYFTEPANENDERCYVNLQQKIDEFSVKISQLDADLSVTKKALFSIPKKLQNDDYAVKFYTGFPNYSLLQSVFEFLEPKVENISYWRGPKSHEASKKKVERQESNIKLGCK